MHIARMASGGCCFQHDLGVWGYIEKEACKLKQRTEIVRGWTQSTRISLDSLQQPTKDIADDETTWISSFNKTTTVSFYP